MAQTVNAAFEQFLREEVNLEPTATASARASRDWLVAQISQLPSRQSDFPQLYPAVDLHYGSFARRTKIRELDDVDLIIGVSALGTTYEAFGTTLFLTVPDGIALSDLRHPNSTFLNSRRVINRFIAGLTEVPQYEKADLSRNGSAAVLKLRSYPWTFDIVPGFFTTPEQDGRTYYVIPNGDGHWMKTDPRVDQERAMQINQAHRGHVLNSLRLLKFWNRRPTMPSIPPYVLECPILNYYQGTVVLASEFVDLEFIPVLRHVVAGVLGPVADPKGIQGDLNSLSWQDRFTIANRANADVAKATVARVAEQRGDHEESIRYWGQIFGPKFPKYE